MMAEIPLQVRVLLKNCTQSFTTGYSLDYYTLQSPTTYYFTLLSTKLTTQFKSDYSSKKLLNLKYSAKIMGAHDRKVQYLKYKNQRASVTMLILNP
jgi:hypothetical protein